MLGLPKILYALVSLAESSTLSILLFPAEFLCCLFNVGCMAIDFVSEYFMVTLSCPERSAWVARGYCSEINAGNY